MEPEKRVPRVNVERATRLGGAWLADQPGVAIVAAAAFGVVFAGLMTHSLVDACFAATRHWVSGTCTHDPGALTRCTSGYFRPGHARVFWGLFQVSAQLCTEATRAPPWVLVSGMVAAPSVLLTWYWRDRKRRDDHRLAVESGIAERYTRAAELLASADSMTRINGLFSLWDVARESQSHRVTVSRTLAAFVRVRSTADTTHGAADASGTPLADVQTAATLAAELEWASPAWHGAVGRVQVDLRGARLVAFDLARTDLSRAMLRDTDFSQAFLHRTNLQGALLMGARFCGAFLRSAVLRGANLRDADLSGSNLLKADLREAHLNRTNFSGARYCAYSTRFPPGFDPEARGMTREDLPPEEWPLGTPGRAG
jgi:hypothetical protein